MDKSNSTVEIEITAEMIEAGKYEIETRWMDFTGLGGFRLWDEVLSAVFRAMSAKCPLRGNVIPNGKESRSSEEQSQEGDETLIRSWPVGSTEPLVFHNASAAHSL